MPRNLLRFNVGRGTATGIDPSYIDVLQESEGVHYKPGDPAAYKVGGRTLLNASPIASASIDGILFADLSSSTPRLYVLVSGNVYAVNLSDGTATLVIAIPVISGIIDGTQVNSRIIIAGGGSSTNRDVFVNSSNVAYQLSLLRANACTTGLQAGPGITGTFEYWVTEWNETHDIESAAPSASSITPANQVVRVTRGNIVNSGVKWRVYRSIASGKFPVGWRIAELASVTTTYDDSLSDTALVLNSPYNVVNINGSLYSRDDASNFGSATGSALTSVAMFEDSLIGTADDTLVYSETGVYGSFPVPYRIRFPAKYSTKARCVRVLENTAYVNFDYETFRVNYLPKASDPVFDAGICQEFFCHYGTPSARGAAVFSGWGGRAVLFVAGYDNPMLMNSDGVDKAVSHIDWQALVPTSSLSTCTVFDNPGSKRVEMHYQSDASDSTKWSALHFYYDPSRIGRQEGPFPEMVWTGPHRVPGPGVLALNSLLTTGNRYQVYSGSKNADGFIYLENQGVSDAAHLIDGSGTIRFRLRTHRAYVGGPAIKSIARRVHVHKVSGGTGVYAATITAHKEEDGTIPHSRDINATVAGYSSAPLNESCRAIDVRVVRDDALAMPGINDIAVEIDDVTAFGKTTRDVT